MTYPSLPNAQLPQITTQPLPLSPFYNAYDASASCSSAGSPFWIDDIFWDSDQSYVSSNSIPSLSNKSHSDSRSSSRLTVVQSLEIKNNDEKSKILGMDIIDQHIEKEEGEEGDDEHEDWEDECEIEEEEEEGYIDSDSESEESHSYDSTENPLLRFPPPSTLDCTTLKPDPTTPPYPYPEGPHLKPLARLPPPLPPRRKPPPHSNLSTDQAHRIQSWLSTLPYRRHSCTTTAATPFPRTQTLHLNPYPNPPISVLRPRPLHPPYHYSPHVSPPCYASKNSPPPYPYPPSTRHYQDCFPHQPTPLPPPPLPPRSEQKHPALLRLQAVPTSAPKRTRLFHPLRLGLIVLLLGISYAIGPFFCLLGVVHFAIELWPAVVVWCRGGSSAGRRQGGWLAFWGA